MLKPRLEKFYEHVVCEDFILLYNFENISNLPYFERLILDSTSSSFTSSSIAVMQSFGGWLLGTGQKCVKTRARKSIALFDLRKNNLLGLRVTCRKSICFALLDKVLVWVLPQLLSVSEKEKTGGHSIERKSQSDSYTAVGTSPVSNTEEQYLRMKSPAVIQKQVSLQDQFSQFVYNYENSSLSLSSVKAMASRKGHTSFFTISDRSARCFPEMRSLDLFFDKPFGFSLSCSVVYRTKNGNARSTFSSRLKKSNGKRFALLTPTLCCFVHGVTKEKERQTVQYSDSYFIKRQFVSAFQYPEL